MEMITCRATPAHVVRCVLGTTLRLAVYGSVLNLALSVAGKTDGFWATKVSKGLVSAWDHHKLEVILSEACYIPL